MLYALAGALLVVVAGGVSGGWMLDVTATRARLHVVFRYLTHSLALGGLSPVQSLLVLPIGIVLFWHLDWLEPTRWVSRVILSALFGIPLAAELALRYSESTADGWINRFRSATGALQEQAPALAGRLIWVALSGILLQFVMAHRMYDRPEMSPAGLSQNPATILPITVLVVLMAFLLWIAGGLFRTVRFDATFDCESADPEQCEATHPGRPWLVWGLVAVVLLWPVVMTWFASDSRPLSLPASQPPESPMLPWTTDWGSTAQGRDLHALLYDSWRSAVYAGVIAAALAATVGVLWRFGSGYLPDSARNIIEIGLFRVPPILLFLVATGLIVGFWRQAMDYQTNGIAVALVLLPQSLRLMRIDCGKVPTTIACQILLGTLLALGWSNVGLQFIGLMSMGESTFSSVLTGAMSSEGESQWLFHRSLALILVAVISNLIALGALVWTYNLPRELTRLRG